MPRIVQLMFHNLFDGFRLPLPDRPVDHTCLAEPAPSGASAEGLNYCPVVDHFNQRNDRFLREKCLVQIRNQRPLNAVRRPFISFDNLLDRSIFIIDRLIKPWNIDAGKLADSFQIVFLGLLVLFHLDHLRQQLFSIADEKGIDNFGQRFRVIGARPAGQDDWEGIVPFLRQKGDLGQRKHIEQVGKGKLVLQGESQEVQFL